MEDQKDLNSDQGASTWLTQTEFKDDKVIHPMSIPVMEKMQTLVQARMKNPEFLKQFENIDLATDDGMSKAILATYCHTCFELGVEKGLNDIDHIINEMLDKQPGEKNDNNTETKNSSPQETSNPST